MAAAQQEAMKGAGLLDVADAKGIIEGLDSLPESTRQALMTELPEGDRTEGGLKEVIRSPQFQQAVGQLDHVLQSGQGRELLMSMGITPPQGFDNMGPAAVRAFLQGLQKKADEDSMKD
uniref:DEUBAD domain-containing protein n=1 Tax=Hemiselmis andersenii TaxID=464988 RepID=A0A6U4TG55_HEMAN